MPILANIEGQIVFLVIAGIVALVNWLRQKAEEKAATNPPPTPRQGAGPVAENEAEAERMRRFMEALGLPADQVPKPRQRPAPAAAPPPLPARAKKQKRQKPAPQQRVEEIHIPELRTNEVSEFQTQSAAVEFHTKSAEVSAIPTERRAQAAVAEAPARTAAEQLRKLLRSREEIRSAILLREVLGPPKGTI
jgi:hypothetical protein